MRDGHDLHAVARFAKYDEEGEPPEKVSAGGAKIPRPPPRRSVIRTTAARHGPLRWPPDGAWLGRQPLPAENPAPRLRPRDRCHRTRIQVVDTLGDLRGPRGLYTFVSLPFKTFQETGC